MGGWDKGNISFGGAFALSEYKKPGEAEKRAGKNFYPVLAKQICGAFP